ncbi:hypothetical protein Tco_1081611 [Tanacetum coccineum]|uniref:Uncharacterized protein n=1 Tax=Tanacetum coccineum TaxID=301880 RepID=A0ABQ5HY50_9ASTR
MVPLFVLSALRRSINENMLEYVGINTYVLGKIQYFAGNPVKKILLKLNLSDHRLSKMVVEVPDSAGGTLGIVGVVTSPEPIRPDCKLLISGPAPLCPGAIELGPSLVLGCTEVIVCSSDQNSLKP